MASTLFSKLCVASTGWNGAKVNVPSSRKMVWVCTGNQQVMTTAVEGGWTTFLFTQENKQLAKDWTEVARIEPLFLVDGEIRDGRDNKVARFGQLSSPDHLQQFMSMTDEASTLVVDPLDWQVIPAENLIAAFQDTKTSLFLNAKSAADAKLFLEALETGTDGVVLETNDPAELFLLKEYFASRSEATFQLSEAVVTRVEQVGMGDRVCVDLCSLLMPGEGLLVGSFSRCLFLVHSECLETSYIASRPFRVNAGPVHAYVARSNKRTSYLSELKSGDEVVVVNPRGQVRVAVVGRLKIESRPLLLIEAESQGFKGSLLLQNAETVCLVEATQEEASESTRALPVSKLQVGDKILVSLQDGARHTGVKIQEFIVEK